MAVKNANYIKSQIIADDEVVEGVATDDNGLKFNPDTDDIYNPQVAYATHSHLVTETNSPIWNQVTYDLSFTDTSTMADGHVTLQGITDMGEVVDIMQHYYDGTSIGKKIFDLYGSSCTNAVNNQIRNGAPTTNTFQITMPKQYENYEDVDVMANWYDPAWRYRIAIQFERSLGKLRGAVGHKNTNYYGVNVVVPYKSNMTDGNFTDIRFTANDGITKLDFYILNFTASGNASCIVMLPWWFVDKEREPGSSISGTYANADPQWIYCYYGNASATSASDITLGGRTYFYDDFDDNSIDTNKWTVETSAHGTIQETGGKLQIDVASGFSEDPQVISTNTGAKFTGDYSFEAIFVIDELSHINSTTNQQGPVVRLYADGNGWFENRFAYDNTAPVAADGNAVHWNYHARSNGTSGDTYKQYRVNGSTTSDRYVKATYICNDGWSDSTGPRASYGQVIWSVSSDGIYWDVIGRSYRITWSDGTNTYRGGPPSGDVKLLLRYSNKSGAGTAGMVKFDKVIMYPIVGQELEYLEDQFTNGANVTPLDRWSFSAGTSPGTGTATEAASYGSTNSGTPGTLTIATPTGASSPYFNWTASAINCPMVYTAQKQAGLNSSEVCYYQAKIDSVVRGGGTTFGGIFIGTGVTAGSGFLRYGIQYDGTTYTLVADRITPTTSSSASEVRSLPLDSATITLPCHIRIAVDHMQKKIGFDYSTDGIEWKRVLMQSYLYFDTPVRGNYHKGSYMGMFSMHTGTNNSGYTVFNYFSARTGMKPSTYMLGWNAEEAYSDYPLETTTTDKASMTLTYPMPTNGPKRGNCVKIRSKPYGGDYTNSKTMYVNDKDWIYLGPDGTDKYIGLKLEFDFNMMYNDDLTVTGINYIYEVM